MDRVEKLRLSASEEYGHCFKQGLFMRLYERSLYWFVTHAKPVKPMLERVKDGEPIVYGGLPVTSFEKLLEERQLHAEATENGWKWRYAKQPHSAENDFSGYAIWREAALAAAASNLPNSSGRNILREIRIFNLANSTPIQAMSAVADWQEYLRNREGAG